jgi:hypothetical protein
LHAGENVLAIHGLNVAAPDADFLVLPELVGVTNLPTDARYFTVATPGGANTAGVLGVVRDTDFSAQHGFFNQPFEVSITTASPDSAARCAAFILIAVGRRPSHRRACTPNDGQARSIFAGAV